VQSRYLDAAVGGVRIGCLYLPNGNPAPGPKFDYKLRWLDRLAAPAAKPVESREPVVLAGVPPDQIYDAGLCTAMNLDVLTSYRAEKENAGRIAGVIRCGG
jgi:hypothetical protein